ncbi:hypothetical protein [Lentibacillus salicampi]|uniref:Uncharacterized protein n=1 Tax=Lentibacillus salicampi TaxID=175306 RepID=A0A4Y9A8P8_9BACI|nr:hypothetical protein [Lentibacillus salicampi]TFJ91487.1 hypothetical protein E4U82_17510 [Lentibacillus salicampi]
MGRQVKGLLYFFVTDMRRQFIIFWSILIASMLASIIIAYMLLNLESNGLYFGKSGAMYIFCSIFGFVAVKEGIPFAIKMGATRKNLFVSVVLLFLGISILQAVFANTLHTVVIWMFDQLSITTFNFVHPAQLLTDTWLSRVVIDTTVMFFLLSVMYVFGLIFYRTGLIGGGSVAGAALILAMAGVAQGWLADFFIELAQSFDMVFFYQIFAAGIIVYGFSWLFIRNITTVKVR